MERMGQMAWMEQEPTEETESKKGGRFAIENLCWAPANRELVVQRGRWPLPKQDRHREDEYSGCCHTPSVHQGNTTNQFIKKHQAQVVGMLSGWDRSRFRGTLKFLAVVPGQFTWLNEEHVLSVDSSVSSVRLAEPRDRIGVLLSLSRPARRFGRTRSQHDLSWISAQGEPS
jgi:hypothetical protein